MNKIIVATAMRMLRTAVSAGMSAGILALIGDIQTLPFSNFYMPTIMALLMGASKFLRDRWEIDLKVV